MNDNIYKSIIKQSPIGFAYTKPINDENGVPRDYEFIDVNISFEKLIGFDSSYIIGKKISDIFPDNKHIFDLYNLYGDISADEKADFEYFSESSNKWYRINVCSPAINRLIFYFTDISKEKKDQYLLSRMSIFSEELLQFIDEKLDYKKITENFLELSESKFAAFNLYDEDGKFFTTIEIAGDRGVIKKAKQMLGMKTDKQKWAHDTARADKIKYNIITRFSSLAELTGDVIPRPLSFLLVQIFDVGQILVVKIIKNNIMLGDFTCFMPKGKFFCNDKVVELYTRQIGLAIVKQRENEKLQIANKELISKNEKILYLSYHDQLTGLYNRRFFEEELIRIDTNENLPISVIMGDVNGLKFINDSLGHIAGDELLKKAADVLKMNCGSNGIISRTGGDEFIIILPKTESTETENIIRSIKELLSDIKVHNFTVSISFGFDTKLSEDRFISEVLANAEKRMYKNKIYEYSSTKNKTINTIMDTLFEKNIRVSMHSKRVSEFCRSIADKMNFNNEDAERIRIAGLVHDIGKIGIDEKILNKTTSLNDYEIKEIEKHTEIGWRILKTANDYSESAVFVLAHHERWDGSGYPNGLKGEEIPLESRIIAVADAYDAMTRERSYHNGLSIEKAIAEIQRCSGTQFDPNVADVFLYQVLCNNTVNAK